MKMFHTLRVKIVALFVGLAVTAVVAANSFPPGITVGLNLFPGFWSLIGASVDVSTDAPVIVMTGQTISVQVGGANTGRFVATGATTGASTFTFSDAMPNGRICGLKDLTTPADALTQTNATTGVTVVTFSGTIVSGDTLVYDCHGF